jgi:hypothetical protein
MAFRISPMSGIANRVKMHLDHAIEETELMHKAIDLGDYIPSPWRL